jgi:hypothetical protein
MIGCYIIEAENKEILGISISKERKNMFVVAEHFLSDVVVDYGPYPVSTDCGTLYPHQAYKFLKINHQIHSPFEKPYRKNYAILQVEH